MLGQRSLPPLTLIIGGAASGKSEYAEDLVRNAAGARVYLATGRAEDAEMKAKIDRHKARRGEGWHLIEAPLDPGPALAETPAETPVLFDCATMWLANQMFADRNLDAARDALVSALAACPAPVVVVTNEVGQGIVPGDAMSRAFRDAQGRLNIALAQQADCVVQVTASLPLFLKGNLG